MAQTGIALVTGASGFIGSAVVRALLARGRQVRVLARGRQVRVLVRPTSSRLNLDGLALDIRNGSLEDEASLVSALDGCEFLFHAAADYRLWVPDPEAMYAANILGTRRLMEAALAAGLRRIVYTSSVATLGFAPDGGLSDEGTPSRLEDMIGPYKRSKFLAEAAVRRLVAEAGLPAVIVNPTAPIGPRDIRPTPTGRIVVDAASGRMPAYVDTGLNIVHVDDVAAGHVLALERGRIGERYVLGGDNMTLAEILRVIADLAGRKPPRLRLPCNAVMPVALGAELISRFTGREPLLTRDSLRMARKTMFYSSAKAQRDLGYAARPARQALADALAWFRQEGYCP